MYSLQKNEVKNSYAMELEGLKRSLERIADEQVEVNHTLLQTATAR